MIETFSDALPPDIHRAAALVMREAAERRMMIALAESCTGGLLAATLTDVEGCAHAFDRGFVTYTDEAKTELLGVPAEMIRAHTAVSAPVARAMASGALGDSDAMVALSVTGFAGPGAPGEEAGLVYFGIARRHRPAQVLERRFGAVTRAAVRRACLRTGFTLLHAALRGGSPL